MSAWIRSAVNKAVEVGGSNNLTRTVRNYADTVVQHAGHAVAEGAKLLQDRIAARNFQSFKLTVKRLEEVSVSCRGLERVLLLRRWLVSLKEIERLSGGSLEMNAKGSEQSPTSHNLNDSPKKPTVILYYDADLGGEPMNFRDVFLHSQALEGMVMSMILEEPNEEEVSLLTELFGMCLIGGKEVHNATIRSILDLAKAFLSYDDEVLTKREELLQYAQAAIAGLKVNADITRIDLEVSNIHQNLDGVSNQQPLSEVSEATATTAEIFQEPLAHIQLCSRLEALLLKKKFSNYGDSPEIHAKKVDKLKVLSESLVSSASKTEKRIMDHRSQKEEALNFRVTKTTEVSQLEKELATEIVALEKQRDELEAQLKKVNTSLASANARLHNAREEREQFDEANNEILQHFKTKEDELLKCIASYRAEADTCNALIKFLEATWSFQSSHAVQTEKLVNDELERHEEQFVNLALLLLSTYKAESGPLISNLTKLVENLKGFEKAAIIMEDESLQDFNPRKNLEQEYVDTETKLITMFKVVESIRNQFYNQKEEISRKGAERIKELCDDIEKIKDEFQSTRRPTLVIERVIEAETLSNGRPHRNPASEEDETGRSESNEERILDIGTVKHTLEVPSKESSKTIEAPKHVPDVPSEESSNTIETPKHIPQVQLEETSKSPDTLTHIPVVPLEGGSKNVSETVKTELGKSSQPHEGMSKESSNHDEELSKLDSANEKESKDRATAEIGGWEFDELEKELKEDESASKKLITSNEMKTYEW